MICWREGIIRASMIYRMNNIFKIINIILFVTEESPLSFKLGLFPWECIEELKDILSCSSEPESLASIL